MAYRIQVNKRFINKTKKVYEYLAKEWNFDVADAFYEKIQEKFALLKEQPMLGSASKNKPGIYKVIITKHNIMYYRVKNEVIIIINLVYTARDPRKNPYEY